MPQNPLNPRIKRLLLAHIFSCSPDSLISKQPDLTPSQEQAFKKLMQAYGNGKPLSRILGYREFWSLRFYLNDHTLDPRPDSETLIESVLETFSDKNASFNILDLGTGTGCLAISLLTEYPHAQATLVDVSQEALQQAQENATVQSVQNRCQFILSNWLEKISGQFDLVVCNPPYIDETLYENLDKNVKAYDPKRALTASENGLSDYKKILKTLREKVTFSHAFFEIGFDQEQALISLIKTHDFRFLNTYHDIEGRPRVVHLTP